MTKAVRGSGGAGGEKVAGSVDRGRRGAKPIAASRTQAHLESQGYFFEMLKSIAPLGSGGDRAVKAAVGSSSGSETEEATMPASLLSPRLVKGAILEPGRAGARAEAAKAIGREVGR